MRTRLGQQPGSDEEFSTHGQWVHDNLRCRLDIQKLWRYTFYSKQTERRYTRAITKQMWDQRDSDHWVVYVGAVARAWRFGDGEHEIGSTDISGMITVAVCRRIDEQLVKLEVRHFRLPLSSPHAFRYSLAAAPHALYVSDKAYTFCTRI
jgi:hypothetical protein